MLTKYCEGIKVKSGPQTTEMLHQKCLETRLSWGGVQPVNREACWDEEMPNRRWEDAKISS